MYASQTKRLCVRGASSDETTTRVQPQQQQSQSQSQPQPQPQPSTLEASNSSIQLRQPVSPKSNTSSASSNMTASAMSNTDSSTPLSATKDVSSATTTSTSNDNSQPNNAITSSSTFAAAMAAASIPGDTSEQELINKLASETLEETKLQLILSIRNLITACNKKKDSIVNNQNFKKLTHFIDDEKNSNQIKTQIALLLCSLAKAGEHNVEVLNELMVDDKILSIISASQDQQLIEACLRCLRAIMSYPKVSRAGLIYESDNNITGNKQGCSRLQKIIECAQNSDSFIIQECVADIFAVTCDGKNQAMLFEASALTCIVRLLESPSYKVVIAALGWLTQMCSKNQLISLEVVKARCPSGVQITDRLLTLMNKDNCNELQFLSARCFAHIYKALVNETIKEVDSKITTHILPTLVRMVHKDKAPSLRVKSADCIAYLIEGDKNLQNTASICDHLIDSLANMLEFKHNSILLEMKNSPKTQYKCSRVQDRGVSWLSITSSQQQEPPALDLSPMTQLECASSKSSLTYVRMPRMSRSKLDNDDISSCSSSSDVGQEMKRAAFLALASLASIEDSIRSRIFHTGSVMHNLIKSLTDGSDAKTLKSVLTCLLSLSRSVHHLRTSFAEGSVYAALKSMLTTSQDDVLFLVLAILCNISLDFSPGKQHFMDAKTIEIICNFTRSSDPILRLHGMWILMNMVWQMKDLTLKLDILKTLDIEHVLSLLMSDNDEEVVLKTLGFLRNLLSQKNHIDNIMSKYGNQIINSMTQLLQRPFSAKIKEHTLCVLTNIADGPDSKMLIMENEIILTYLSRIISDEQGGDLRLAAMGCITNLAHRDSEGSSKMSDEMKKFGFEEKLKSILDTTNETPLSDRVKTAYSYFLLRENQQI